MYPNTLNNEWCARRFKAVARESLANWDRERYGGPWVDKRAATIGVENYSSGARARVIKWNART